MNLSLTAELFWNLFLDTFRRFSPNFTKKKFEKFSNILKIK